MRSRAAGAPSRFPRDPSGGGALFIDYGHNHASGDSVRAIKEHLGVALPGALVTAVREGDEAAVAAWLDGGGRVDATRD